MKRDYGLWREMTCAGAGAGAGRGRGGAPTGGAGRGPLGAAPAAAPAAQEDAGEELEEEDVDWMAGVGRDAHARALQVVRARGASPVCSVCFC